METIDAVITTTIHGGGLQECRAANSVIRTDEDAALLTNELHAEFSTFRRRTKNCRGVKDSQGTYLEAKHVRLRVVHCGEIPMLRFRSVRPGRRNERRVLRWMKTFAARGCFVGENRERDPQNRDPRRQLKQVRLQCLELKPRPRRPRRGRLGQLLVLSLKSDRDVNRDQQCLKA